MKFKKAVSFFLTMALFITSVVCFAVSASAESIEKTAKSIDSDKSASIKLNTADYHDYKIKLSKSGDLKITLNTTVAETCIVVYDSDGAQVRPSEKELKADTGKIKYYPWYGTEIKGAVHCEWSSALEKFKGTAVYKDLDKGTYYVRIFKRYSSTKYSGTGKSTVKMTYPQEKNDSDDSNAKITGLQLNLKKGGEAALSALMSGNGDVTWSSSKKAVATVSKNGNVKAVGKGTAVITAKCGNTSAEITIKVE